MKYKVITGIMLTLLLVGMLTCMHAFASAIFFTRTEMKQLIRD